VQTERRWEVKRLLTIAILIIALACIAASRSGEWRRVRNQHIASFPYCALCGAEARFLKPLEVHHIKPFHLHPELELDTNNLVVLCRNCHYQAGHLGVSWSYENTNLMSVLKYGTGRMLYEQRKTYKEDMP
jgi:hypothetical protein